MRSHRGFCLGAVTAASHTCDKYRTDGAVGGASPGGRAAERPRSTGMAVTAGLRHRCVSTAACTLTAKGHAPTAPPKNSAGLLHRRGWAAEQVQAKRATRSEQESLEGIPPTPRESRRSHKRKLARQTCS